MNIIVCVKQVPDLYNSKVNMENGLINRSANSLVNNPHDLYAVEEGIRLKEKYGGTVTAVSMGPPKCENALRELISMGVDNAILLTDKEFAGSDTLATSWILASAIKKLNAFDIILTGKQSSDGDTGQVGPSTAQHLNIKHITNVCKIFDIDSANQITVQKLHDEGYLIIRSNLPVLIGVTKQINEPRYSTITGLLKAKSAPITSWSLEDLKTDFKKIGLEGSATRVVRVFKPSNKNKCQIFVYKDNKNCIPLIISEIKGK